MWIKSRYYPWLQNMTSRIDMCNVFSQCGIISLDGHTVPRPDTMLELLGCPHQAKTDVVSFDG